MLPASDGTDLIVLADLDLLLGSTEEVVVLPLNVFIALGDTGKRPRSLATVEVLFEAEGARWPTAVVLLELKKNDMVTTDLLLNSRREASIWAHTGLAPRWEVAISCKAPVLPSTFPLWD